MRENQSQVRIQRKESRREIYEIWTIILDWLATILIKDLWRKWSLVNGIKLQQYFISLYATLMWGRGVSFLRQKCVKNARFLFIKHTIIFLIILKLYFNIVAICNLNKIGFSMHTWEASQSIIIVIGPYVRFGIEWDLSLSHNPLQG